MANRWHVFLLRRGVWVWNRWRSQQAFLERIDLQGIDLQGIDLRGANLLGANLRGANLTRANLRGADLSGAGLYKADLSGANLSEANLSEASLSEASLSGASLYEANLYEANLDGANLDGAKFFRASLRRANLYEANLAGANLAGANLAGASFYKATLTNTTVGFTIFGDVDLREVQGLDTLQHFGPSTIGIDTLYRSQGDIPERFLRGCGVPDSMIAYARSLVAAQRPTDYYSVFISYSSYDEAIAQRLHADLQSQGVRCWFAPHDLEIGTPIAGGIDEAIGIFDKLLIVLSESSVKSNWVAFEVSTALHREVDQGRTMLFPIRLDDTVLHTPSGWAAQLRTRHIGDFRGWKDHDAYQTAFTRLLRDLKAKE